MIDASDSRRIAELQSEIRFIELQIEENQEKINSYRRIQNGNDLYKYSFEMSFNEISSIAVNILLRNAMQAVSRTTEFNDPRWFEGLYVAIRKKGSITIRHISGTNTEVTINLDRTAGTLEEYAASVVATREALNMGQKEHENVSKMWREKIYQAGREGRKVPRRKYNRKTKKYKNVDYTWFYKPLYWKTINTRKSFWSSPAPWWRLLEYGNSIGLASDRGYDAYPVNSPTYFVRSSQQEIENIFAQNINEYLASARRSLSAKIGVVNRRIKELNQTISELKSTILDIERSGKLANARYLRAKELILVRLGNKSEKVDPYKLERLLQKLAYNETYDLQSGVRLGGGVRIRVMETLEQINYEFGVL